MLSALFPPSPKVESLRGSKDAFSEMMSRARVLNAFNSHPDPPDEDEDKDDPELQLLYYSCGKPPPCAFEKLCPGSEGGVGCQCYTCEQEALIHFSSHKQQCGACWGGAGCDGCEWCESVKSGHYARVDPLLRQMAQLPAEMVREIIGFAVGGHSRESESRVMVEQGLLHPARAWLEDGEDEKWRLNYWEEYERKNEGAHRDYLVEHPPGYQISAGDV
ncbi:hypothetical protein TeGR_g203 [Tetraparma gracilis]|uniref:Uncharacterized protein n=1 Tax=Tetraparma gracilis TaxID=2962635 RepID=A0ABQ6MCP1_9STRA|nr:hypothetical protein TeGR_g203 [Tetraparma gracilis]